MSKCKRNLSVAVPVEVDEKKEEKQEKQEEKKTAPLGATKCLKSL